MASNHFVSSRFEIFKFDFHIAQATLQLQIPNFSTNFEHSIHKVYAIKKIKGEKYPNHENATLPREFDDSDNIRNYGFSTFHLYHRTFLYEIILLTTTTIIQYSIQIPEKHTKSTLFLNTTQICIETCISITSRAVFFHLSAMLLNSHRDDDHKKLFQHRKRYMLILVSFTYQISAHLPCLYCSGLLNNLPVWIYCSVVGSLDKENKLVVWRYRRKPDNQLPILNLNQLKNHNRLRNLHETHSRKRRMY